MNGHANSEFLRNQFKSQLVRLFFVTPIIRNYYMMLDFNGVFVEDHS